MTLARPRTAGDDPDGREWFFGDGVPDFTAAEGALFYQRDAVEGGTVWRQDGPGSAANWREVDELSQLNLGELAGAVTFNADKAPDQYGVLVDDISFGATRLVPGGIYTWEYYTGAGGFAVDYSDLEAGYQVRYLTPDGLAPGATQLPGKYDIISLRYRPPVVFVWASLGG